MVIEEYLTIKKETVAEITEKKSHFIAYLFPIKDSKDADEKINKIKKLHRDAKHNVFAYRIVNGIEKYSDDGEPSGTAGMPILNILKNENLQNILVVVTRYFGGILLGTGGLVRAYSEATKKALDSIEKAKVSLHIEYKVSIPYNYYDIVKHYCSKKDLEITSSHFSDLITLTIKVKSENKDSFYIELTDLVDRNAEIVVINNGFYA